MKTSKYYVLIFHHIVHRLLVVGLFCQETLKNCQISNSYIKCIVQIYNCPKTNIWSSKILINKLAQTKWLKSLLLLVFFFSRFILNILFCLSERFLNLPLTSGHLVKCPTHHQKYRIFCWAFLQVASYVQLFFSLFLRRTA